MFTEKFIRDTVLPSIRETGGATVLTSPYGMPPSLLVMDQFQPANVGSWCWRPAATCHFGP